MLFERSIRMWIAVLKIEPPRDKTNNVAVCPAKTQISLGIHPVWSASSLCPQWVAKGPSSLHADSEDSDQTGRMPRLIWVFAGRTLTLLVLSQVPLLSFGEADHRIYGQKLFWRQLSPKYMQHQFSSFALKSSLSIIRTAYFMHWPFFFFSYN